MTSFYAKFIPQYSKRAATLHALKRKGVKFDWTEERQVAFDTLSRPRLKINYSSPRF